MREYELTVVYDLAVQEAGGPEASVELLTNVIETRGGKLLKVDHWGRRRMAYPINRMIDGDYIVTRVEFEPNAVAPLEATLGIDERIFRHLIVRADELPLPLPPREPRQQPGFVAPAPVADVTGVLEQPATSADAAALGAAGESPAPVASAADVGEGQAPASGTIAEPAADDAPAAEAAPVATEPPPHSAAEAIENAEVATEAAMAPTPEPAAAAPLADQPLESNTPQSTTTGYTSDAAELNSGVDVTDEDDTKPTGPHTEQDD